MVRTRWFVPVVILVVCWSLTTHGRYSDSGDEPHYLMVMQSLVADRDLDLSNNYAEHQGRAFGAGGLEAGPHVQSTRDGRAFPVHDIGLPILLVPVYVFATHVSGLVSPSVLHGFRMTPGLFAYSIISLFMIAIACASAAITRASLVAAGARAGLATCIVLVVWLSPPVLSNSFLVFPEGVALLATAWSLHFTVTSSPKASSWCAIALGLGLLPWFHRKYVLYGAAWLVVLLWRHRARFGELSKMERGLAAALFIAPQVALAAWTWQHWGNLGGPLTVGGVPFSWRAFESGSAGLLVDRENGLFVWAPALALLPAAWALGWRRTGDLLVPVVLLFLMSAAHDQWWGGFSPAARFLVPLAPVFALVAAVALEQRVFRRVSLALVVPQLLIAAYGWQHTRALWPQGDGHNRVVGGLLGLIGAGDGFLPSLRTSVGVPSGAIVWLVLVAAANVLVWLVERRAAAAGPATA